MFSISTKLLGPLFSGLLQRRIVMAEEDMEKKIAVRGAQKIRARMAVTFRKQRPVYRFKVRANPEPPGWAIHDQGMVQGPWLEGTGSRNRTTRFKGYRTFRIITQELNNEAPEIANGVVAKWMGGM